MIIENYIDLCSGTGCFPKALERAGVEIKNHFFSEIDKYAISNYKYNFPRAQHIGGVEDVISNGPATADFITGGWPCQGNSIAGKRGGLKPGSASSLLFKIADVFDHYKPRRVFLENVEGLLTVNKGTDILEAMRLLTFLSADSPQYDLEMQLLNTSFFGIPQNRERTYFVGHCITSGPGRQEILPIRNSDKRITKGTTETAVINTFTAGGNSGGHHSGMTLLRWQNNTAGAVEDDISPAIRSSGGTDIRKKPVIIHQRPCGNNKGNEFSESPTITGTAWKDNNHVEIIQDKSRNPNSKPIQKEYTKGNSQGARVYDLDGVACTQSSQGGGQGAKTGLYEIGNTIRRFTPVEVERLFDLTDNWTKYGINEKGEVFEISDTQRYKMCGNGIPLEPLTTIFRKLFNNQ